MTTKIHLHLSLGCRTCVLQFLPLS